MKTVYAALFLFCLTAASVFPQNDDIRMKSAVDWENGRLVMELNVRLDVERYQFPEARREAEARAEEALGRLFLDAFSGVLLHSSATAAEFLADPEYGRDRRRFLEALPDLTRGGVKTASVVAPDFKSLTIVYEYGFYGPHGLVAPFVPQDQAAPLPAAPGYHATRPFSGLVIYARGMYPAFGKGEDVTVRCAPALFPRLFYLSSRRTIELVLDMTMVEPAALKARGMVAYVRSSDPSAYAARVGLNPLTVTAFAVYGTYDTDLVISEKAARTLFANQENRELLRQGKIAVIID